MVMLAVPDRFNKNAPDVRAMGPPAETGSWLLNYMCERLSIPDLRDCAVLDFGCGSRFADAIVNRQIPVKSYVGIDSDKEMIEFFLRMFLIPGCRSFISTREIRY